ncbi:MAG: hypothetical protein ACTSXD_12400 [Candidatus Heimdallarchaeaceae archaeon]
MKIKNFEIKEIERRENNKTIYPLEIKIIFTQKKDREEFLKIVKDNLR